MTQDGVRVDHRGGNVASTIGPPVNPERGAGVEADGEDLDREEGEEGGEDEPGYKYWDRSERETQTARSMCSSSDIINHDWFVGVH